MSDKLTKRAISTLRVLLRQHGIEEGLTEAIELWMAIHWVVVPWCAEHDEQMSDVHRDIFTRYFGQDRCRLEEPARHYVIGEAE